MSTTRTQPTFADRITTEAERARAGGGCGHTCDEGCHGPLTCVRLAHDHDPDGAMTPHAGFDQSGAPVQWTCQPGDHDGLTDEERAAAVLELRRDTTRVLFAAIDPQLLVQLLRDGGHL